MCNARRCLGQLICNDFTALECRVYMIQSLNCEQCKSKGHTSSVTQRDSAVQTRWPKPFQELGNLVLHSAVEQDTRCYAAMLQNFGIDITEKDEAGLTVMDIACRVSHRCWLLQVSLLP